MQILASVHSGVVVGGDYESINTVTVGSGGQSTITFSSIPATFKHLQVRYMSRSANASTTDILSWRFNSDSGSNYSRHFLFGDGGGGVGVSGAATSDTRMTTDGTTGATATSGIFGVGVVDILDYADTNKYKTLRALSADDRNGAGLVVMNSGNWRSFSAVSTITIITNSTANFAQHSQFALYGIRG